MSNRLDHYDLPDLLGRTDTIDRINAIGPVGRLDGREGELDVPSGPSLIPPAPSFPGMSFAQFIPANLFLGGVLALNDPIDSLPLYGDLIPGGAFTAAGSARPLLSSDGSGRYAAAFNGTDTMPEITGLTLDLTGGCTVYFVFRRDAGLGGVLRADSGDGGADKSRMEIYSNSGGVETFNQVISANRISGLTFSQVSSSIEFGEAHSLCGVWSNANETRGIYRDGVKIGSGGPAPPAAAIENIQLTGYNKSKLNGFLYTEIIYNGVHVQAQINEVCGYIRQHFNNGAIFYEPEP